MVGGPHFLVFFDAADNMAIRAKLYDHAKVGSFRDRVKGFRVCICLGRKKLNG